MWISTSETKTNGQTPSKTGNPSRRDADRMPHFSDEDKPRTIHSDTRPRSSNAQLSTAVENMSLKKKAIKTYSEPVRTTTDVSIAKTSTLPPRKSHSAQHISWKLGASLYAAGTFASGTLFAALSQQEREVLLYFFQQQLSVGSAQPFERFLALFLPALLQVVLVMIFSYCAFGAPLIGILITLSGIASGTTALTWMLDNGSGGILFYVVSIGLYQALLTAVICHLGQNGIHISSRLFSAAFRPTDNLQNTERESRSNERFLRSNLSAVIGLVAICGFHAATSDLCRSILQSIR